MKANKNYRFEKIEAVRSDGKVVRGRLYLPLDENKTFRTAIFAHGFAGCYRDLMHYGPRFAEEGLALCLFDFCGGSPLSASDGTMMDMTVLTEYDDYLVMLRKLKEHPQVDENYVFLMGESQGGYVASLVAARHPEESSGMVLWYPSIWMLPKAIDYAGLTDKFPGIQDLYKEELPDSAESANKEKLEMEKASKISIDQIKASGDIGDLVHIWGFDMKRSYIDDMLKVDMEREISSYPKDVLIIQGDKDEIVPLGITYKTVRTFPHAQLKVIPGGGHGFEGDGSLAAGNASISYIKNFR